MKNQKNRDPLDLPFSMIVCKMHILLVIPHGRAGSYMMQCLLDNHSNVLSLPKAFSSYNSFFEEYTCKNTEEYLEQFVSINPDLFSDTAVGVYQCNKNIPFGRPIVESPIYDKPLSSKFIAKAKENIFEGFDVKIRSHCLVLPYLAYRLANKSGCDVRSFTHLVLHQHLYQKEQQSIYDLSKDFQRFTFIAMVRDPLVTFKSYLKLGINIKGLERSGVFSYALSQLELAMFAIRQLSDLCGKVECITVDLDKFNRSRELSMKKLSKQLDIKWCKGLLKTTINGCVWGGNSVSLGGRDLKYSFEKELNFISPLIQKTRYLYGYIEQEKQSIIEGYWKLLLTFPLPGASIDLISIEDLSVTPRYEQFKDDIESRIKRRGVVSLQQWFGLRLLALGLNHLKQDVIYKIAPINPLLYIRLLKYDSSVSRDVCSLFK